MQRRLSTGITLLDEELDGGVPVGSLIALEAAPDSQSDLLIQEFATADRTTVYFTTRRSEEAVNAGFKREGKEAETVEIIETVEDPLTTITKRAKKLPGNSTIIIDRANVLEAEEGYESFLRELQNSLIETNSVGLLYRAKTESPDPGRELTLDFSDIVFSLHRNIDGEEIENRLGVLKSRGGPTIDKLIKVELDGDVRVDRSRDIS